MENYRHSLYNPILAEIRKALAEERITQTQIGEALELKQSAVSSLLSGKSRMSLDQFLTLSDLIGVRPQNILQHANAVATEVVNMTPQIEEVLYRSEIHTLAYVAAIREITPADLYMHGTSNAAIQQALDDLVRVELLEKRRNKYVQKNPQRNYRISSKLKSSKVHQQVVLRAWNLFDRMYNNKAFIATKFNAYKVDRFTVSQSKEIESALWKVWERIESICQANAAAGYSEDENMPLWNVHLMLTTPLDPK
jgi:predicted transcriptional regulator